MKRFLTLVLFLVTVGAMGAVLADADTVTPAEKKAATKAVQQLSKETSKKIPIGTISNTPIPGLLQITSGVDVFYITSDGKYLIVGEILDPSRDKKSWSLTEGVARQLRTQVLAKIPTADMIIYPATAPKKANITVFTDIDCPYCRKMQQHIKDYTDKGIEVRYLAFPRSGPKTPSFDKAVTVWCSKDRNQDYTAAVEGTELPKNLCAKNPVKKEFDLAQELGVNGTPTIFLDNGMKLGGLVDPDTLEKIINGVK